MASAAADERRGSELSRRGRSSIAHPPALSPGTPPTSSVPAGAPQKWASRSTTPLAMKHVSAGTWGIVMGRLGRAVHNKPGSGRQRAGLPLGTTRASCHLLYDRQ